MPVQTSKSPLQGTVPVMPKHWNASVNSAMQMKSICENTGPMTYHRAEQASYSEISQNSSPPQQRIPTGTRKSMPHFSSATHRVEKYVHRPEINMWHHSGCRIKTKKITNYANCDLRKRCTNVKSTWIPCANSMTTRPSSQQNGERIISNGRGRYVHACEEDEKMNKMRLNLFRLAMASCMKKLPISSIEDMQLSSSL